MSKYHYKTRGDPVAPIVLYPETSSEEDSIYDILGHLDDMWSVTYDSCWSYDGNTECWSGYALYWDDHFVGKSTGWTDGGDYRSDLSDAGFDDKTTVHLGLVNNASDSGNCGGAYGRSPYCTDKKPVPYVDMGCQSNAADAAQTAAQEGNHCLIYVGIDDVSDLTGPDNNQHSLGKFVDGGVFGSDKCTPLICGYGGLDDDGNCTGGGSGTKNPKLSFTNCTHYSIAVSEGYCK